MSFAYEQIGLRIAGLVCQRLKLNIEGVGNIPLSGSLLLVGKHQREADGAWVLGSVPRPVRIVIKNDANWPTKAILGLLGNMYPIKRNALHPSAYRRTISYLRAGEAVVMFPEAHRVRELIGFHPGVAGIARRVEGTPIVPFCVLNSEDLGVLRIIRYLVEGAPKEKPTIRFGLPFVLPPATEKRRSDQYWNDAELIRDRVAALMPPHLIGGNDLYVVPRKK
jgi:1-acyl-sn-glycerol-3-phosphate acyltransferase